MIMPTFAPLDYPIAKPTFQIGDSVIIINKGQVYSSYNKWFDINKNRIENSIKAKHAYNQAPKDGTTGIIVAYGPHSEPSDPNARNEILYAVEIDTKVYIMGAKGLKLSKPAEPEEIIPDSTEPFVPYSISFEELLKGEK